MEPEDQFSNECAALFRKQIEQFAKWLEKGWRITERDNEANEDPWSPEKMDGWNAALGSIPDALELYLNPDL
jgi:hypothetical protein